MRVSEVYLSVQGEGPNVGCPTVFVRFGGCNLRCPGWPCDTQHAIDPKYRNEWLKQTPEEVYSRVLDIAQDQMYYNVCLTGGEPFLQNSKELEEFVELCKIDKQIVFVECFSNGALTYPDWVRDSVDFVMDWKLPGSGEQTWVENRYMNLKKLSHFSSIKFTIANADDYATAKAVYDQYVEGTGLDVFYGVVWGRLDNEELISWVLRDGLPWKLNIQIHNYVWDRNKRGI